MPAQAPPGPRPRAPTRPGRTPLPAARPSGRDRPAAKPGHAGRKTSMSDRPSGANDYNTKIIEEFRANEGRVGGPWAGAALILIHHIGAKSGTERVSPVGYFPQGEGRFAIVASNGGSPAHPDWYYNLKAHPRITVKVGTQTFTVWRRSWAVPGLLTWLADQWPGRCAMPRGCARGRRRVGRWGRRWLLR